MSSKLADHSIRFSDVADGFQFVFVSAESYGTFTKLTEKTYRRDRDRREYFINTKTGWNRLGATDRLVRLKTKKVYEYYTMIVKATYHGDAPADLILLCERVDSSDIFCQRMFTGLSHYVPLVQNGEHLLSVEIIYVSPSVNDKAYLSHSLESVSRAIAGRMCELPWSQALTRVTPRIYSGTPLARTETTIEEVERRVNVPTIEIK
jgi:hypothetical protein